MAYCGEGGGARTVLPCGSGASPLRRPRSPSALIAPGTATATWSPVAKWSAGNAGGDPLLPGGIAIGPDRAALRHRVRRAADDQYVEVYAQPATGVPDGTSVTTFGALGTGNGQFKKPLGVDTDPDGDVFVSDFERIDVQPFDTRSRLPGRVRRLRHRRRAVQLSQRPHRHPERRLRPGPEQQPRHAVRPRRHLPPRLRPGRQRLRQNICTTSCAPASPEPRTASSRRHRHRRRRVGRHLCRRQQRPHPALLLHWRMGDDDQPDRPVTSPSAGTLGGLSVDDEGRIFVVDDGDDDRILVFSPAGQLPRADRHPRYRRRPALEPRGTSSSTRWASSTSPSPRPSPPTGGCRCSRRTARIRVLTPIRSPPPTPRRSTARPTRRPSRRSSHRRTTTLPPVLPPRPPSVARPRKTTQTVTSPFKVKTGLIVTCYPPGTVCDSKLTAYIDAALGPTIASASAAKRLTVGRASFATRRRPEARGALQAQQEGRQGAAASASGSRCSSVLKTTSRRRRAGDDEADPDAEAEAAR